MLFLVNLLISEFVFFFSFMQYVSLWLGAKFLRASLQLSLMKDNHQLTGEGVLIYNSLVQQGFDLLSLPLQEGVW